VRHVACTREARTAGEEVAQVEADDDLLGRVRGGVARHRAALHEAVRRLVHGHVLQQVVEDAALRALQVGLGNLEQAQAAQALGLQLIAVVRGGGAARRVVFMGGAQSLRRRGEPGQALRIEFQPLRELGQRGNARQREVVEAQGAREHLRGPQDDAPHARRFVLREGRVERRHVVDRPGQRGQVGALPCGLRALAERFGEGLEPRRIGTERGRGACAQRAGCRAAGLPDLGEQHHLQHLAQVAHAAGAAGAALEADDALHRGDVAEAPEPERVFQVREFLAELVQVPVLLAGRGRPPARPARRLRSPRRAASSRAAAGRPAPAGRAAPAGAATSSYSDGAS
jgi:hypothetical protein